jgi:hypothetical protein
MRKTSSETPTQAVQPETASPQTGCAPCSPAQQTQAPCCEPPECCEECAPGWC